MGYFGNKEDKGGMGRIENTVGYGYWGGLGGWGGYGGLRWDWSW